ncbi:disulfide reductase [bacterium]|nr:MAG: disulfide reductase [bacterium]
MKLSFYPGCTAHSTAWEFITSTKAVMGALGVELQEIEDWNCCGGASARVVDNMLSLGLPARNLLIAKKTGKNLLAPCAGCFNNVRRALTAFNEGGEEAKALAEELGEGFGGEIDVWSFIDFFESPRVLEQVRARVKKPLSGLKIVAYYGCQMVRPPLTAGCREWENPTALEKACEAVGATALDWSYKVDCCGADMGISHGKHCAEIVTKICEEAKKAGADAIVVSCGLCSANLDMRQKTTRLPVIYITELLGAAFQCEGVEKWWKKHIISPAGLF